MIEDLVLKLHHEAALLERCDRETTIEALQAAADALSVLYAGSDPNSDT